MADNTVLNIGTGGDVIATDDIGGVKYQVIKPAFGPLDTATLVTASVGLPTDPLDRALRDLGKVDIAAFDSSLPAGANNIGDVDVLTLPALVAGTANIGDVDVLTLPDVTLAAGTNTNEVVGDAAHDAP